MRVRLRDRIPMGYMVVLAILLVLVVTVALWFAGYITFEDIYANFFFIIFQLTTITILAILGAVFLGMLLSHRILTTDKGFTPMDIAIMETNTGVKELREEVARLREEIRDLKERSGASEEKGKKY